MDHNLKESLNNFINYQLNLAIKEKDVERLQVLREIVLNRQFVDAPEGLSQEEYNRWLVKNAKKSFILTLETPSILMGNSHNYKLHSKEELETKTNIGNLTVKQINEILDSIDVYTIMKLICDGVEIFEPSIYGTQYGKIGIGGYYYNDGNLIYLESYPFREHNRKLTIFRDNKTVKSISDKNAYEYLYRGLRMPIKTVLGSINQVNTQISCDLSFDPDLCESIYQIQKEEPIEVNQDKKLTFKKWFWNI